MNDTRFRFNWKPLILPLSIFFFLIGFLIWEITWPAVQNLQTGQPLPPTYSWPAILGLDIAFLTGGLYLLWLPMKESWIGFTEQYVKKSGLVRKTTVYWRDVQKIEIQFWKITILSKDKRITIYTFLFQNAEKMVEYIRAHVPEAVRTQVETKYY